MVIKICNTFKTCHVIHFSGIPNLYSIT